MDSIFNQLEACNTTFAPIANAALGEVLLEQEPAWHDVKGLWDSYHVLATLVAGIMIGYRLGYARGLQDGNPLLHSRAMRWLLDYEQ